MDDPGALEVVGTESSGDDCLLRLFGGSMEQSLTGRVIGPSRVE